VQSASLSLGEPGFDLLVKRKPMHDDAEFDITAMIDLVFMMNIYFLVKFLTVAMGGQDLPTATHVAALDADTAQIITLVGSLDGESITVYLGERQTGDAVVDLEQQNDRVREYVEQGLAVGKADVLIKAERKVRLGDYFRIATAASIEGVKLHDAVVEKEAGQ
jgi:biopolymer transport protein ExbD